MLRFIKNPKGVLKVLFKEGGVKAVYGPGKRWVLEIGDLHSYAMGTKVDLPKGIDLRSNLNELRDFAEVVDLKQDSIAVVYVNGVFSEVLIAGLYAYWKGVNHFEIKVFNTQEMELPENMDPTLRSILARRGFIRLMQVEHGEQGLLLKDGSLLKVLEPGEYFFWNNQLNLKLMKANMQRRAVELNGQEMLTKDKASLRINLLGEIRVVNIERALLENKDYDKQAYYLLSMALRSYVSELSLDELLSTKVELAEKVAKTCSTKLADIGLELLEVGIRDIILPGEMRQIMNEVLVAEKRAQANSITRREETASTRSLMNTAKLMENNPMLWKLKEMEYLEKVVSKVGTINITGGDFGANLRELLSPA